MELGEDLKYRLAYLTLRLAFDQKLSAGDPERYPGALAFLDVLAGTQLAGDASGRRYASQRDTLRSLPLDVERFRPAPRYDFLRAPHEGLLWYEARDWGIDGARFRELAGEALRELEIAA